MTNLFGHSVRSELLALYIAEALICFIAFYTVLRVGVAGHPPADHVAVLAIAGLLALCGSFVTGATGLYQNRAWIRVGRFATCVVLGGGMLMLAAQIAVPYFVPGFSASSVAGRIDLIVAFVGAVLGTRIAFALIVRSGIMRRRVILVDGPGAELIRSALANDMIFQVAHELPHTPRADDAERLRAALRKRRFTTVVAADSLALPADLEAEFKKFDVRVWDATQFLEHRLGQVNLDRLPNDWLQTAHGPNCSRTQAFLRRSIDITLALVLLAFTLPLLLLAAIAVRLDSPGPILYRQTRVGLHGKNFKLFKFRSMTANAEAGGKAIWAMQNDPRVTRVGRILRLTRIDEIPQVFNVLRGEMAFVGPRPERPEFVANLNTVINHYADRHSVRPGITGWAQVNYPYGASEEDARMKLRYDLYYVRRRSLFLDMLILVATVRVVLFHEGSR